MAAEPVGPDLTPGVVFGYLVGRRAATEAIVRNPHSLRLALVFVFLAALARFYDQVDLLHRPWWLLRPFVLSFFIAAWLFFVFWVVDRGWLWERQGLFVRRFLPLFWMTAPLAWLYGLPLERWLDGPSAVRLNFLLLAVVSLWRVGVLSRALSVAFETAWPRPTLAVLLGADSLFVLASIVWSVQAIPRLMSPVEATPTQAATDAAVDLLGNVSAALWPLFVLGAVAALVVKGRTQPVPDCPTAPTGRVAKSTWALTAVVAAVWLGALPWTQAEQLRRTHAERLLQSDRFAEAVAFLSEHRRGDFPPLWEPFSEDWGINGTAVVRCARHVVETDTPAWVRTFVLAEFERLFKQPETWWLYRHHNPTDVDALLTVLENLPPDSELVRRNVELLEVMVDKEKRKKSGWSDSGDLTDRQRLRIRRLIQRVRNHSSGVSTAQ